MSTRVAVACGSFSTACWVCGVGPLVLMAHGASKSESAPICAKRRRRPVSPQSKGAAFEHVQAYSASHFATATLFPENTTPIQLLRRRTVSIFTPKTKWPFTNGKRIAATKRLFPDDGVPDDGGSKRATASDQSRRSRHRGGKRLRMWGLARINRCFVNTLRIWWASCADIALLFGVTVADSRANLARRRFR